MKVEPGDLDRSHYRRIRAPVLVRPVGLLSRRFLRQVARDQASALRAYSDDPHPPGRRLELEILLPDRNSVTLLAEVAWLERLPPEAPARYDVGLRYVSVRLEDLERVAQVLEAP